MSADTCWTMMATRDELALVAAALRLPNVVVLDGDDTSPPGRWDGERVRAANAGLVRRGYAEIRPDGGLVLDAAIAALFTAVASTTECLLLTVSQEAARRQRLLFTYGDILGDQELLPAGQVAFTFVKNSQLLVERSMEFLDLPEGRPAPAATMLLRSTELAEADRLAEREGPETCRAFLAQVGCDHAAAAAMASALSSPKRSVSAEVLAFGEGRPRRQEKVTWLVAGRTLLEIKEDDTDESLSFRVRQVARRDVRTWLQQAIESARSRTDLASRG